MLVDQQADNSQESLHCMQQHKRHITTVCKWDRAKGTKGAEQRAQRGQSKGHKGDSTEGVAHRGAAPKPELLLVASSLTPGSA